MNKFAIIIYGPPGSGKGTQANLLAWNRGFIHFDTGRFCEQVVHDPAKTNDPVIQRERILFDTGVLMTPSFVFKVVREKTAAIAQAGMSIVYSGSPRTMYETFGDGAAEGLIALLAREYGKQNIHIFALEIKPEDAIARNKERRICSVCRTPVMASSAPPACSICGGSFEKRTLDDPGALATRIREYEERTFPILAELERGGYAIQRVDARPLPFEIHQHIVRHLDAQGT